MYTWVPTHKAIAEKLLAYENKQQELIQILKDAGETILSDIDDEDNRIELQEIDPFSFFFYINKYGSERRLERLRQVAKIFDIEPLPEDDYGIPSANAQRVWLFPQKKDRQNDEINRLWSFFKLAMSNQISNDDFSDILTIKGTGKTKITEALFYINPEQYLPINTQSRPYLDEVLGIDPDFKNWIDYERILQKVKNATDDPFYKISYDAYLWNTQKPEADPDTEEALKDIDRLGENVPQFHLHELALVEAIANIEVKQAFDFFYDKADLLIQRAGIESNMIHANVREDNRLQITLGRRYTLMIKRKSNMLNWWLLLDADEEQKAVQLPEYDSSGFFGDADGGQTYCWVIFSTSMQSPIPDIGDMWDKWLNAATKYFNETKGTRLIDTFKRFTNPAFLKSLYDSNYRKHIFERAAAFSNYPIQKFLIEKYKAVLRSNGLEQEKYKWEILGKPYWDLNAPDLLETVKSIPFKNLTYPLAIGALKQLVEKYPEEMRNALRSLFEDDNNLVDRIKNFRGQVDALYKTIEPDLPSHHDERTISIYLAFYDPDKYPIYKSSFYSKYCKLRKRRQATTNEKYQDYNFLLQDLITNFINKDEELINIYRNLLKPDYYLDKNYLLLAQDMLYRLLDGKRDVVEPPEAFPVKKASYDKVKREAEKTVDDPGIREEDEPQGEPNFWWLNANPAIWSISSMEIGEKQTYTSRNEKGNKRRVYKYFETAQKGDFMIGYESTPVKQIKALLEVTKGLHQQDGEEVIEFEMVDKLNVPVHWTELQSNPALSDCEVFINNQGSLFKVTEEEYDIIREIIDEKNIAVDRQDEVSKKIPYSYETDPEKPFISGPEFKQIIGLLKRKKNIILQGPPGVGKTFIARKIAYEIMGHKNDAHIEMVQFHQSFSYEDFIQGLRPDSKGGFKLTNGVFYTFCQKAHAHPDRQFFFIIDEINRGNLSKIFGELMMLIEPDKRKEKFALKLTYADDELDRFYIPENLSVIGTMNTADRSLAIVDYALRRRFAFITLRPDFGEAFHAFLKSKKLSEGLIAHIVGSLKSINREISGEVNLGAGFQIGHSYFCNYPGTIDEKAWLHDVIDFEIKPLLDEIWFDDPDKVKRFVNTLKLD